MKKIKIITCAVFAIFVFGMTICGIVAKDKDFSENENRVLASAPEFSWKSVLDGKFQNDLETYLSDQVVLRDSWITVKTFLQKTSGNTDIGGAYVGKDGYDFEKIRPEDVSDKQVSDNTSEVEEFFSTCSSQISSDKMYFLLVPTAAYCYQEKLPKNAIMFDQEKLINQIQSGISSAQVVDLRDCLMDNKDKQLFYRTDHHWTSLGALVSAEKWCVSAQKDPKLLLSYGQEAEVKTEDFRGSLYSKILDADSSKDEILSYKDLNGCSVVADGKEIGGLYQDEKLSTKDKYAYFFGGNYGELSINNAKSKGQGNLLVVKDSFANTFVPLISGMYDNIYMIDLRYYNGDVSQYIKDNEITEVMVLYNVSNFISDKNLFKLNM